MTSCTVQSNSQDRWVARQHANAGVGVIFMGLFCGCLALSGWNFEFTPATFVTGFVVGSVVGFCAVPVLRYSGIRASVVWWTLGSGGIIGTCVIAGWVQYFLGIRSLEKPYLLATALVEGLLLTLLILRLELRQSRSRWIGEQAAWAIRIGFWLMVVAFTLRPLPAETRWATVGASDNWYALEKLLADDRGRRFRYAPRLQDRLRQTVTQILQHPLVAPSSPDEDLRMDTLSFQRLMSAMSPRVSLRQPPMTSREEVEDALLALRLCRALYSAGLDPATFRSVVMMSGFPGGALQRIEPELGLEDTEYLVAGLREILKPEPPIRVRLHAAPNSARRNFVDALGPPRVRPLLRDVFVSPMYPLAADMDRFRSQWTAAEGGSLPAPGPLGPNEPTCVSGSLAPRAAHSWLIRMEYDETNLVFTRIVNSAERRLAFWKQFKSFRKPN